MRNLKKFLALVLSMMMVLSLFVTASAASIKKDGKSQEFNDTASVEFKTAIEVLNGMEVLKGDANPATGEPTGNFRPNDPITRAEVAALVFRLSTGLTDAGAADHYARYGNFSDVPKDAWYAGYVGYCANAGYIKGYQGVDGPFGPTDNVTGYQALAMILRAMGYGVNGEFEGGNWILNVSAIGTQTGILNEINNSHFGNATLYNAAPRQVVAQIYFKAAMENTVVYTPAYGYQTANMSNYEGKNASLGYVNFGLDVTDRVIVGNQDTGETCTRLGEEYKNAAGRYAYPNSVIAWNDDGTVTRAKGLDLKVETDLNWFGHRVTAYFDARDDASVHRTYAIYDEAKSVYVYATDGDAAPNSNLSKQASAAKLSIDPATGFHVSDRYGWISNSVAQKAASFAAINTDDHDSGNDTDLQVLYKGDGITWGNINVKEDTNTADDDDLGTLPYGSEKAGGTQRYVSKNGSLTQENETGSYYRLVSNGGDKVDLVITVAPELERVTEHNTTASVPTVRLSGKSDVVLNSSEKGGYNGQRNDSTFGELDNGIVRMSSLTPASEKAIGSLVVGWEIKGTNYSVDYQNNVNKDEASLYRYYLQPASEKITGTVKYYHADTGEVVLDTGNGTKTLYFTLLPIVNYAVAPSWSSEGDFYFYNNVQYTFTLDPTDSSRYVTYGQGGDYEFLYATYADHKDGGLGTADLDYYVTGVKWDGSIVENAQFTTINKDKVAGWNYENLIIAKKNMGGATDKIGNEIQSGWYAGYAYNAGTKDLDVSMTGDSSYDVDNNQNANWDGYGHTYWADKIHAKYNGNDGDGEWTITRGNVADGWSDQPTNNRTGSLLLTPNTKFIIVDGVGVGSNKTSVEIKNGIGDLLGTASSVTIDVKRYAAENEALPEYNAYYKVADEQFNNWYKEYGQISYSDDNWMVDTVILPRAAIKWSEGGTSLWFTNVVGPTGYYLANVSANKTIEQYRMWRNGVEEKVFIDWDESTDASGTSWGSATGINSGNDHGEHIGTFYELTQIDTINGEKIYKAEAMKTPACDNVWEKGNSVCNIDLKYDYTAVNNLNTARLTSRNRNNEVTQSKSNVYNVTNANVTNLVSGINIKDIKSLNEAVSVGYRVTVAIVNDGHSVSQIYVTQVEAPGWTADY